MLHINSRYRSLGTFDEFTVQVPPTQGKTVRLLDASISQSQYNINSNNNLISSNEIGPGPGFVISLYEATLTPGSYSAASLATEIKTQLDAEGGQVYTVTYSSVTNAYTISAPGTFSLAFDVAGSPCYELGFAAEATPQGTTTTSSSSVNLAPPGYLFLSIEGLGLPTVKVASLQPGSGNFPLVMTGSSYTVSTFGSETSYSVDLVHSGNSGNLRVRLTDAQGRLAGLRGDWSFTLLFA